MGQFVSAIESIWTIFKINQLNGGTNIISQRVSK